MTVALRELHIRDVVALADLGVDELVIVDGPPEDAQRRRRLGVGAG